MLLIYNQGGTLTMPKKDIKRFSAWVRKIRTTLGRYIRRDLPPKNPGKKFIILKSPQYSHFPVIEKLPLETIASLLKKSLISWNNVPPDMQREIREKYPQIIQDSPNDLPNPSPLKLPIWDRFDIEWSNMDDDKPLPGDQMSESQGVDRNKDNLLKRAIAKIFFYFLKPSHK